MKRLLIIATLLLLATSYPMYAQQEGVITYEVKVNMHRSLPEDRQELKDRIPEYDSFKEQLVFNPTESLFEPVAEANPGNFQGGPGRGPGGGGPGGPGGGGPPRRFRPRASMYVNQPDGRVLTQQEFFGKRYLIERPVAISPWKLGTETKTILGYPCMQASFYDEAKKQEVVAWYTNKLRPFLGPDTYNTLPGAVLEVDIDQGLQVITAVNIEPRELKKNELKEPTNGTKVTPEEFEKIMAEQREKMEQNRANGGGGWRGN